MSDKTSYFFCVTSIFSIIDAILRLTRNPKVKTILLEKHYIMTKYFLFVK